MERRMRCAIPLAFGGRLAVVLAGCPETTPATPAADAPIPTESNFIHGSAWFAERIKIAPGADFTVQLIDTQLADTPNAVIATTTLEDVAGPPYDFSLQYDPAKIRPNGQYGLSATLRGVEGELLFNTPTRASRSRRATRRRSSSAWSA